MRPYSRHARRIASWFAAVLLAALASAQTPAPFLALNDVNLIDGRGSAARPHARIVIRGDRIAAVDDAARPMPPGAVVWNLHGMTVIPGLIDAHVHLTSGPGDDARIAETLRFGLLGGVTAVRDMGGDDIVLQGLARRFGDPQQPVRAFTIRRWWPARNGSPIPGRKRRRTAAWRERSRGCARSRRNRIWPP